MIGSMKRVAALVLVSAAAACSNADTPEPRSVALADAQSSASPDTMIVYKSPTCGCCSKWVDHIEENGFVAVTRDVDNLELARMKQELGVPASEFSCHTAIVAGYTIEGHVPADAIRRLLTEKPAGVRGLAVPDMPVGSPGMEGLFPRKYDIHTFDDDGNVAVYESR